MSINHLPATSEEHLSSSKRLLYMLKTRGPQQASGAGKALGMTAEAARQQFTKLATEGLVTAVSRSQGVGRPSQFWQLTAEGEKQFPDTHPELTVQLLEVVRDSFGEQAIEILIAKREQKSRELYWQELGHLKGLTARVARLAEIRSAEGYMAEYETMDDGSLLLIENHCPICAAAATCQGFCRAEQAIFTEVLEAEVVRVEHILSQSRRCAYRVKPYQDE
ncbi:transcriptional regulator [Erwinia rhapontici]|uniref:Transcriptional regulator n=3 Tax=Erwiniaceae TaxID=1903409 RepID=A0ABM7MWR7_ERWRD|nr:putative ArsR family transcriptional regulator [Erwinia rhapontici]TDS96278.1 transcriptional regulator [Erwinia rhapontici]BCQ33656.1 transcriptional regulator [Erwinia rhapontici]BCQ43582.1 transcriptional regulator [Erwinia rhapontici]